MVVLRRGNLNIWLSALQNRIPFISNAPQRPSWHRKLCSDAQLPSKTLSDFLEHAKVLSNITVVRTVREAAVAITALLELPETDEVAWSVQRAPNSHFGPFPYTLSAYGGDSIDFGNGSQLLVPILRDGDHRERIWDLFRDYFSSEQAKKVWFDYSDMQHVMSLSNTLPLGVSAELIGMSSLLETQPKTRTLQGFADAYLRKEEGHEYDQFDHFVQKPMPRSKSRPWENIAKRKRVNVDETWITAACADAALLYNLHRRLRKLLRDTPIRGQRSCLAPDTQLTNLDQVYDCFFVPVVRQLHAIRDRGVMLERDALNVRTESLQSEMVRNEQDFIQWASSFSPDAKYMDPHNNNQLRQVLFGPRSVDTVDPKVLSGTDKGCTAIVQNDVVGSVTRKEVTASTLQGYGAKAAKLTKTLSPSMSAPALRQAMKFGREKKEGFERNDAAFCDAVDKLLRAKEIKAELDLVLSKTSTLNGTRKRTEISYDICGSPAELRLAKDQEFDGEMVRRGLVADSGNTLLAGRYLNLDAELLFYFSGCTELESRLEKGIDMDEQLALDLFDEVKVGLNAGDCVLSSASVAASDELMRTKTITDLFPEQLRKVKALNWCMIRGCRQATVRKIVNVNKQEAKKLTTEWHKLHPGVSLWQEKCKQGANTNMHVESLMGRKLGVRTARNGGRTKVLASDIVGKLMEASIEEVSMQAFVKLGEEQTLQALDWHVVFVDGDTIVLEGPTYAAAVARDILEYEMEVVLGSKLPVDVMEGPNFAELQKVLRVVVDNESNRMY